MDKIQMFLIKNGRKDLAQEYYEKWAKAKGQIELSYKDILGIVRNLKSEKQLDDFKKKMKKEYKKLLSGFTSDKKNILKSEIEKKEKLYKIEKQKEKDKK